MGFWDLIEACKHVDTDCNTPESLWNQNISDLDLSLDETCCHFFSFFLFLPKDAVLNGFDLNSLLLFLIVYHIQVVSMQLLLRWRRATPPALKLICLRHSPLYTTLPMPTYVQMFAHLLPLHFCVSGYLFVVSLVVSSENSAGLSAQLYHSGYSKQHMWQRWQLRQAGGSIWIWLHSWAELLNQWNPVSGF